MTGNPAHPLAIIFGGSEHQKDIGEQLATIGFRIAVVDRIPDFALRTIANEALIVDAEKDPARVVEFVRGLEPKQDTIVIGQDYALFAMSAMKRELKIGWISDFTRDNPHSRNACHDFARRVPLLTPRRLLEKETFPPRFSVVAKISKTWGGTGVTKFSDFGRLEAFIASLPEKVSDYVVEELIPDVRSFRMMVAVRNSQVARIAIVRLIESGSFGRIGGLELLSDENIDTLTKRRSLSHELEDSACLTVAALGISAGVIAMDFGISEEDEVRFFEITESFPDHYMRSLLMAGGLNLLCVILEEPPRPHPKIFGGYSSVIGVFQDRITIAPEALGKNSNGDTVEPNFVWTIVPAGI